MAIIAGIGCHVFLRKCIVLHVIVHFNYRNFCHLKSVCDIMFHIKVLAFEYNTFKLCRSANSFKPSGNGTCHLL
jgi:hypothetical protein